MNVSNVEKIIDKMKRKPNGIRPEEVEKVLKNFGYELSRQKGNPLKRVYIVDVLNRIEQ